MKVRITYLKAPWPQGLGVGSYTEFAGDEIPGWAVGKCVPITEAEAEFLVNPEDAAKAEEEAAAKAAAEAEAAAAATVNDLRAELEALGGKVDARWGVERLQAEIAKVKA